MRFSFVSTPPYSLMAHINLVINYREKLLSWRRSLQNDRRKEGEE
jgi:hypothetical protein